MCNGVGGAGGAGGAGTTTAAAAADRVVTSPVISSPVLAADFSPQDQVTQELAAFMQFLQQNPIALQ